MDRGSVLQRTGDFTLGVAVGAVFATSSGGAVSCASFGYWGLSVLVLGMSAAGAGMVALAKHSPAAVKGYVVGAGLAVAAIYGPRVDFTALAPSPSLLVSPVRTVVCDVAPRRRMSGRISFE